MANMRHDFVSPRRIDDTIASIRKGAFDMADWGRCICGHALRASGNRVRERGPHGHIGAQVLGLNEDQAVDLFCGPMEATKDEAIRCLEILRDEGVVDWERARRPMTLKRMAECFDILCAEALA